MQLIFPPGWTLFTGGPHLALPMLKAYLEYHGVDVEVADLNVEASNRIVAPAPISNIQSASAVGSMESLNSVYFAAQQKLDEAAAQHGGSWDLRLGFEYDDLSFFSSAQTLLAVERESPFTAFFRDVVVPRVISDNPDLVGFNIACIQQMIPALQLCRALREAGSEAFHLFGGNTITRLKDDLQDQRLFRWVDGFSIYQGEEVLLSLSRALESGSSLSSVPNLIWRDGSDPVLNPIKNDLDPNSVPVPNFDGFPLDSYWGEPFLPLLSARGCYYGGCSFCAIPLGWGENRFCGFRSPTKVFEDIQYLNGKYGVKNFKFVEEAMAPSTIRELSNLLLDEGMEIKWEAYTRMERAWTQTDLPELAARAGFVKGYFGVELAPSQNRALLTKNDSADPKFLFERCDENGILVHMFSMLGFPGTNAEDARQTIEFALINGHMIDTLDIFPFGYARGTREPTGVDIIKDPELDWALEYPFVPSTPGIMGSEEVEEMAAFFEEYVYGLSPRLLHPTYRLLSPWGGIAPKNHPLPED